MDAELLQGFIEETESYLPDIRAGVIAYSHDPKAIAELQGAYHQAQTIKGAASMMQLTEISAISGELEEELHGVIASLKPASRQKIQSLLEKISNLEFVLSLTRESILSICMTNDHLDASFFGELGLTDTSGETETPAESGFDDFGDFEIDTEMLEIFAIEAEDHLKNIGANLNLLEKNPNDREALMEIRRSSHTLKGSAGIVGFKKLSALAHRVEDLLDYLADNNMESSSTIFELLLASTVCLEDLANGKNSPELDYKISEIYLRFDGLMASLQMAKMAAANPVIFDPIHEEEETIPESVAAGQLESMEAPEHQSQSPDLLNRSVIRVSLDRLDDLVKLVSEMVISRSVFEQRLVELEQEIQELQHINNRLRNSTGKLELDYEANMMGTRNYTFPTFGLNAKTTSSIFDKELDEFDVLEFDQYTEFHQTTRELIETTGDTSAIHNGLETLLGNLGSIFDNQRRLIEEMQNNLLRLRMVPLSSLSTRLHRTVRVTAAEEGKAVDLDIENETIEIDTQILDSFIEPLIHLLRNAVAHGIEPAETRRLLGKPERGTISLRAYSEGTHIVFIISDNGRGISASALKEKALDIGFITQKEAAEMSDEQAFSLVFLPGLSTAGEISEVSGRGVGMNVVKSNIMRRQGTISIKSEPQKGTSFTIRLPMSLAVTRALLVKADEQTFAFPLKLVKQVTEVTAAELEKIIQEKEFKLNGVSYTFFHFNELLNLSTAAKPTNFKIPLLLLETSETPCALVVDHIIKPEEIVIKPLGSLFQNVPEIIGATILGDGSVVPVLDLVYLIKKKPVHWKKAEKATPVTVKSQISVLIVDDSPSVRQINSNLIKNAGWQVMVTKDGLDALEILQTVRELPDVILTDVEMPRMDGYELLSLLKRQKTLNSIPVIMITSRSSDKHRRKAYDLGVSEYLTKPYEESVLIEKIKDLANIMV